MAAPLPSFEEQRAAVKNMALSQAGWLRQAKQQEGRRAEELRYSIACAEIGQPGLEAGVETLERLTILAGLLGPDGDERLRAWIEAQIEKRQPRTGATS